MKCRHCGGSLIIHGTDFLMPKYQDGVGLLDTESYHCLSRSKNDYGGFKLLLPHEPITPKEIFKLLADGEKA